MIFLCRNIYHMKVNPHMVTLIPHHLLIILQRICWWSLCFVKWPTWWMTQHSSNAILGITIGPNLIVICHTNIFNFQKYPFPHCIVELYFRYISGGAKKKSQRKHNYIVYFSRHRIFVVYIFFAPLNPTKKWFCVPKYPCGNVILLWKRSSQWWMHAMAQ